MDSFANQLLTVQRQAETLLKRHSAVEDSAGIQQSFLLRGGHFVGVRWEQGDRRAEWTFQESELVLRCGDREQQRIVLQFLGHSPIAEQAERRAA